MKPIVHIDMDDTIAQYSQAIDAALKANPGIQFPQSQLDFFRNLNPIKDAIETVKKISELGFDVYILTAPSIENPMCSTEKRIWIENHLGFEYVRKLIISYNKGLLKGEYIIDDWKSGRGQENFVGHFLHFGSNDFPNWKSIGSFFQL